MSLQLGDTAPNFQAETTEGEIDFYQWIGDRWAVLFSHPKDYTPVCTTELGCMSKMKLEFEKREVKHIALSIDSLEDHQAWILDINSSQNTEVNFPIISDPNREIANQYGMIHPNASDTLTVRSVFIISPDKKIKLTISYPASTGRNFNELLRVIDSLQLTSQRQLATPVNWESGGDCIILPKVTDNEAQKIFSDIKTVPLPSKKTYLRYTADPR